MESVKIKKILIFLISLFVILLSFGILGFTKSILTRPEPKGGEIRENEVTEENVKLSTLHYQIINLQDGIYENLNINYDEIQYLLIINESKTIEEVKKVSVYKIDEMIMVTYEIELGKINLVIYDKEYNEVYTNDTILNDFYNFYITSYSFNDRGIIIEVKPSNENVIEENDLKKVKSIKLLLKYVSNNTFGDINVLDTVYEG